MSEPFLVYNALNCPDLYEPWFVEEKKRLIKKRNDIGQSIGCSDCLHPCWSEDDVNSDHIKDDLRSIAKCKKYLEKFPRGRLIEAGEEGEYR